MDKVFNLIIQHKTVLFILLLAAALCAVLALKVPVNYNLVDYLPKDAQSTTAIELIKDEFEGDLPNVRVMHKCINNRSTDYKEKISAIDGVYQ